MKLSSRIAKLQDKYARYTFLDHIRDGPIFVPVDGCVVLNKDGSIAKKFINGRWVRGGLDRADLSHSKP